MKWKTIGSVSLLLALSILPMEEPSPPLDLNKAEVLPVVQVLPNTGSNEPGGNEQYRELGLAPTNPGNYAVPPNTPPTYDQNPCNPGYHGTVDPSQPEPDSSIDFNRSYQCYGNLTPRADKRTPQAQPSREQQAGMTPFQPPSGAVPPRPPIQNESNSGTEGIPGLQNR